MILARLRVEARREAQLLRFDLAHGDGVMRERVERTAQAGQRASCDVAVVHVEADHLAERMHARIGPSRARGFHVAAEQHAQGILEVALHGGLTRLTSEAAERRAVVRQGQRQGVVAHGFISCRSGRCFALTRGVWGDGLRIHSRHHKRTRPLCEEGALSACQIV